MRDQIRTEPICSPFEFPAKEFSAKEIPAKEFPAKEFSAKEIPANRSTNHVSILWITD
ncbi:MAG: hypothetical protein ACON4H_02715 [Rubripirellula sp.]